MHWLLLIIFVFKMIFLLFFLVAELWPYYLFHNILSKTLLYECVVTFFNLSCDLFVWFRLRQCPIQ